MLVRAKKKLLIFRLSAVLSVAPLACVTGVRQLVDRCAPANFQ